MEYAASAVVEGPTDAAHSRKWRTDRWVKTGHAKNIEDGSSGTNKLT